GTPSLIRKGLQFGLFLFGLASLCYLLGAAVMFFDLPSSSFLRRGFVGGAAWYAGTSASQRVSEEVPPIAVGRVDKPGNTCDGFTLLMYGGNSQARLVDMRGEVIHEWHVPFSKLWPDPPHLRGRIDDAEVYFNDGYL